MLEVKDLKISFITANEPVNAVKGISFNLLDGETLGIVGESGSGKSVTSLAIMRLLDEKNSSITGEINLQSVDLLSLPEDQMRALRGNRIAMIFQEPLT